jgi:crotonobetainyl-CoA:carnitine CoA-transferase CaiB-like acyl-CoA transferase
VADIAAGMYAFSGIVSALYARTRTGRGEILEISLLDALAEWMSYPVLFTHYGGSPPARTGTHHATIAPYGAYRASNGEFVIFAVQTAAEWKRFCVTVLEREDLADNPLFVTNEARLANREALDVSIATAVNALTSGDLIKRLDSANIASARFNSVQGLIEHPQLEARSRWRDVDSPVGPIRCMLPPMNFESSSPVMGAIPTVGEHTNVVLRSLGLSPSDISALRESDVI